MSDQANPDLPQETAPAAPTAPEAPAAPAASPAAAPVANLMDTAPAMSPEVAAELAALRQIRLEMEAERTQIAADREAATAALATAQRAVTSRVRRPPKGERVNLPGEYDEDGQFVHHVGKVVYDDKTEGSGKADGDFGDFVHAPSDHPVLAAIGGCPACVAEAARVAA